MSDKRSTQQIQAEYQQLAFKAGNLQYAIVQQTKDLGMLNDQLRDLNLEFTVAKNAEEDAEAAKKASEAPVALTEGSSS